MLTVEPAAMADLARLKLAMPAAWWRRAVLQMARSAAVTIGEDGEALAIAGLWPEGDIFDLWLWIAPSVRGTPSARRLSLALARLAEMLPADVPVAVSVKREHAPGMRLARLCGFALAGEDLDGRVLRFVRLGKERDNDQSET